jgi:hypothetical protein
MAGGWSHLGAAAMGDRHCCGKPFTGRKNLPSAPSHAALDLIRQVAHSWRRKAAAPVRDDGLFARQWQ